MAPSSPLGRDRVIQLVSEGSLPIVFGSPHPTVMVVEQDGMVRVRELVVDRDAAAHAAQASQRTRSPSWMPEHYYALGQPTGTIYAEAPSRTALLEIMRTMEWPAAW